MKKIIVALILAAGLASAPEFADAQTARPDHFTYYFVAECEHIFASPKKEQCKELVRHCPIRWNGGGDNDECYDIIAEKTSDASWCNSDTCRENLQRLTGSSGSCSALTNYDQYAFVEKRAARRDECLLETAAALKNPDLCRAINNTTLQETCLGKLGLQSTPLTKYQLTNYGLVLAFIIFVNASLIRSYQQSKKKNLRQYYESFDPSPWRYIFWGLVTFLLISIRTIFQQDIFPLPQLSGLPPIDSLSIVPEVFEALFLTAWRYGRYLTTVLVLIFIARKIFKSTSTERITRHINALFFLPLVTFLIVTVSLVVLGAINLASADLSLATSILLYQILQEIAVLIAVIIVTPLLILAIRKYAILLIVIRKVPTITLIALVLTIIVFLNQFAQHQSSCGVIFPELIPHRDGRDEASCLALKANQSGSPYVCELGNETSMSYCYSALAQFKKDSSICLNIPNQVVNERDRCIQWINQNK